MVGNKMVLNFNSFTSKFLVRVYLLATTIGITSFIENNLNTYIKLRVKRYIIIL